MTIPQLTYPDNQAVGVEGQLADGANDRHVVTRVNTTADMFFGQAVEEVVANDNEVETPGGATSGIFAGVTVHTHAIDAFALAAGTGIPLENPVGVIRKGRVLVVAEETVTKTQAGFYRFQNPGALPEKIGRWRQDVDAGDARAVASPGVAVFQTGGAASDLVILEVNIPVG